MSSLTFCNAWPACSSLRFLLLLLLRSGLTEMPDYPPSGDQRHRVFRLTGVCLINGLAVGGHLRPWINNRADSHYQADLPAEHATSRLPSRQSCTDISYLHKCPRPGQAHARAHRSEPTLSCFPLALRPTCLLWRAFSAETRLPDASHWLMSVSCIFPRVCRRCHAPRIRQSTDKCACRSSHDLLSRTYPSFYNLPGTDQHAALNWSHHDRAHTCKQAVVDTIKGDLDGASCRSSLCSGAHVERGVN